ncbi:RNA polymerase sigma factor sigC-like isoform X2 [Ipomoea triloba]|uniref:RNA polymerase sigma factor sigC-like isoform X2 n=1 Tax=Ipomoea triloba TaxID=35885 RepID=UPI00125DCA44|nr:RNA polymerase sigma factor sigC-like isoform X2 [Ipomoea triloba]
MEKCRISIFKGRETLYNSLRTSPSFINGENDASHNDPLKVWTCLSDAQHCENDDSVTAVKMAIGRGSQSGFYTRTCNNVDMSAQEDKLPFLESSKAKHFGFLMQNLEMLEHIFADSDGVRLERDILVQLERIGALELFHTCLERTLKSSTSSNLTDVPIELIEEIQEDGLVNVNVDKSVVSSGKRQERESRRKRQPKNTRGIKVELLPKRFGDPRQPKLSSGKKLGNSRNTRQNIAKNEIEMSIGIKVVAELERLRSVLEEETGRVASSSGWAKAAGLSQKILQQRLHFGWYCRDELLRSTRSLIIYLARNYRGFGVAFDDLIQAGNMGVLEGAVRFDHTRGYKFSTYAQYWIRRSMSRTVAKHARGIRIPIKLRKSINEIQKARNALSSSHGKFLSESIIAEFTGLSTERIALANKRLRVVGSVDQKVGDCISVKFMEFTSDTSTMSPEEAVMREYMVNKMYLLLKDLMPIERQILIFRFGLGNIPRKSLEEIGRLFGVSKEWIRRVESRALAKLRNENCLQDFSRYLHV